MAGHNLYIYLRGGRGDAFVTDLWDGQLPTEEGTLPVGEPDDEDYVPPDGEGEEVSEPYRDIFTAASELTYASENTTYFKAQASSALIYTEPSISAPSPTGLGTGGTLTGHPAASTSDEINHVKPRQFTKVCTWLMFEEIGEDGATFKFRKADVIGWGKHARL